MIKKANNSHFHKRNNSEPHPLLMNRIGDYAQKQAYEYPKEAKPKPSLENTRENNTYQLRNLLSTDERMCSKSPMYRKESHTPSSHTGNKPRIHIDLSSILRPQTGGQKGHKHSQTSMLKISAEELEKEVRF